MWEQMNLGPLTWGKRMIMSLMEAVWRNPEWLIKSTPTHWACMPHPWKWTWSGQACVPFWQPWGTKTNPTGPIFALYASLDSKNSFWSKARIVPADRSSCCGLDSKSLYMKSNIWNTLCKNVCKIIFSVMFLTLDVHFTCHSGSFQHRCTHSNCHTQFQRSPIQLHGLQVHQFWSWVAHWHHWQISYRSRKRPHWILDSRSHLWHHGICTPFIKFTITFPPKTTCIFAITPFLRVVRQRLEGINLSIFCQ